MSRITDAARAYIDRGYFVYPVALSASGGKKDSPVFPGSWRTESINDPSRVDSLFSTAEGIAIDTGRSGIVVIDIDESGEKSGMDNLAGIDLPDSPMVAQTWSGGWHKFFRQPADPVGTGANRPVKDVDFRGEGGIVFAAPTVVVDSETRAPVGAYRINRLVAVSDLPVLPESYAALLRDRKPERPKAATAVVASGSLRPDQEKVIRDHIRTDLHTITEAGPGERNDVLGTNTSRLADRYQKLGLPYESFVEDVLSAYRRSGGTDEKQPLDWCRSSWERSAAEPLSVPRTPIDDLVDDKVARMTAARIAKQRISGETARLLDESSFVDWTAEPGEPAYWVNGVLPQGEQIVLYGKPEAGKTFMAIDWALSVATGRPTFGRATTRGRVLYMSGEGNARITSRIHAWSRFYGVTPSTQDFRLTNHVPDIMNDQVIEQLASRVAEDEVDLVVIDTMGRAMAISGSDIGNPPETAVALKNLAAISKYRPQATPLVIHHPIKDGSMAGSYNLLAGVDVALRAEVDADLQEGTLSFQKNKDGHKGVIYSYRWKEAGRSAVLVPAE